jgi:8-oxo-dGTP pyrophosphatase MutT (NUDIX family)
MLRQWLVCGPFATLRTARTRLRAGSVTLSRVGHALSALLASYDPRDEAEARDVARIAGLTRTVPDPWLRTTPLHVTASALIVHPPSRRVLLRWHPRVQGWLQVGGHGDPGEDDPLDIALREAIEETGLADLAPWPDESLRHAVVVPVPAGRGEPAHEHADLRFFLATRTPDSARPETADAPVRWLALGDAEDVGLEPSVAESLARVQLLFDGNAP